ncbi:ATP-binding protein [Candidatus Contubernalis alkaliaceticus]|uniref:ATP-binding protein n=1 Tax=Candidatus Contubernalis alkaliaceticus TaxID=338645 RepID=UPI001F4C2D8C|nr:ATP-binding protein [Candidatus Contubernalis alkalaceticus]UNC93443.1 ATP-binding protein [Candidatus Contubernalis alkalaceticus]
MGQEQNQLVVMVGLPASGKSTVTRDYQCRGYGVVNPDSIRLRFGIQYSGELEKEIWTIAYAELKGFLKLGKDVVFDATNLTRTQRKPLIKIAKSYGAKVTAHTLSTPLELCLERNENRDAPVPRETIIKKEKMLVPPSPEEGFDQILVTRG